MAVEPFTTVAVGRRAERREVYPLEMEMDMDRLDQRERKVGAPKVDSSVKASKVDSGGDAVAKAKSYGA